MKSEHKVKYFVPPSVFYGWEFISNIYMQYTCTYIHKHDYFVLYVFLYLQSKFYFISFYYVLYTCRYMLKIFLGDVMYMMVVIHIYKYWVILFILLLGACACACMFYDRTRDYSIYLN